jgi:excisionase family DNA binding protein
VVLVTTQTQITGIDEPHGAAERTPDSPSLLTVEQAATRLGTPVRFVRRLIAQRRIAFYRVGRYVRISPTDLAAFIDAGHVETNARR